MTTVDNEFIKSRTALSDYLFLAGISGLVKMATVPMGRDKIMLRITNMADLFDSDDRDATTQTVDLKDIARALWLEANFPVDESELNDVECDITEMTLTGTMPISEAQDRRIQWKTVDDDLDVYNMSNISYEFDGSYAELEAQRIRVFMLEYTQAEETIYM